MKSFPYMMIAPVSREILANAARLSDADLVRIAGELRALADDCMMVVKSRPAPRPRPRLAVDNTHGSGPTPPFTTPDMDRAG
jgi:hypothetical protein